MEKPKPFYERSKCNALGSNDLLVASGFFPGFAAVEIFARYKFGVLKRMR
jgi:hypothetical protein